MNDERLLWVVQEVRRAERRIADDESLLGALEENAEQARRAAMSPAGSVGEAETSRLVAERLSQEAEAGRAEVGPRVDEMRRKRRDLLAGLAREGLQKGRWIGCGEVMLRLDGSPCGYALHEIPRRHRDLVVVDEPPEVTVERARYAEGYARRKAQATPFVVALFGTWMLHALSPALFPAAVAVPIALVVLAILAFALPDGRAFYLNRFSHKSPALHPFLAVLPYTGERWEDRAGAGANERAHLVLRRAGVRGDGSAQQTARPDPDGSGDPQAAGERPAEGKGA